MDSIGKAAKIALADFVARQEVREEIPVTTFQAQLDYLEKTLGKQAAAREAGISVSSWNKWRAGKQKPKPASRNRVLARYEGERRKRVLPLRRAAKAKAALASVRIQISGTVRISDDERYVTNFGGSGLRSVDCTGAWPLRNSAAKLGEFFTELIQNELPEANGPTWPDNDVTITLI